MARSPDEAHAEILSVLPGGWAWRWMRDPRSNLAGALRPLAAEVSRFEVMAEAQIAEVDPRSAAYLLPDYERVLGPDPCLPLSPDPEQRRRGAYARWTARGGASRAFFVGHAAALGVAITIEEFRRTRHGRARHGAARRRPHPSQFFWRVRMPASVVIPARHGAARHGMPRGRIARHAVTECAIRRRAPAHTVVLFSYAGSP